MARVAETDAKPGKHRIYEVVIQTFTYNKKGGRKMNYNHTIRYPGWDEFFNPPLED